MDRLYHRWWSPSLGREMSLLQFGHAGARVVVFPTSKGRFFEWEDRGMIAAIGTAIEQGWFHLFCVDSVDAESWYAWGAHPRDRVRRQVAYERYILDEVIPLSWRLNPTPYLMTTGASFGAYHALNMTLRWPRVFHRALCMSGVYDLSSWMDGYHDDEFHLQNPVDYLRHAHDPAHLDALRAPELILVIGEHDPNAAHNRELSALLWSKQIWHALRLWDGWAHDWPWWRGMLAHYLGGAD